MADQYTASGSVDYVVAAYEKLAHPALVPELMFDAVAEIKPTDRTAPGGQVTMFIRGVLAVATTPLVEGQDVTAVPMTDSTVSLTLAEYGNAMVTTAALRGQSLIEIDPLAADDIGYNAGLTLDSLARNVLSAGTGLYYANGNSHTLRSQVASTDLLKAADVRRQRAALVRNNVKPFISMERQGLYAAYIAPDVAVDLREETGSGSWRQPHEYAEPDQIWAGEVGTFEGFRWIEAPRAPVFANAGNSSANVYRTMFMGREALAKIWSLRDGNGPYPEIVIGPVTDKLRRFHPVGWKWLGGYGIFRQLALRGVEGGSSVDATTTGTDEPTVDL